MKRPHLSVAALLWVLTIVLIVAGGATSYFLGDSRSAARGRERVHESIRGCDRVNVQRGLRLLDSQNAGNATRFARDLLLNPVIDCEATFLIAHGRSVPLQDGALADYLRILNDSRVPVSRHGVVVPLGPGELP